MQQTKICPRCGRENQSSSASCYHCGTPFVCEGVPEVIRDSLARKGRMQIIYVWIVAAVFGLSPVFIGRSASLCTRLLVVLYLQAVGAAVFGFMLWLQAKAAARGSEGEAFRGPMPTWRAVFWTCFAGVGVFMLEYWIDRYHIWLALAAAIFTSSFIGGIAFLANWSRGEHGKEWARKYLRQIINAFILIALASVIMRFIVDLLHRK